MTSIVVEEHGGPEVLMVRETRLPEPGPGQVRVRHEAIGVNFIDTYHRSGLYEVGLPFTPGMEAAGVVDAVGVGVTGVKVGDRVVYVTSGLGAYADGNVVPQETVMAVPDGVRLQVAAATTLKGLTAQCLVTSTFQAGPEHTVLVHAAAGATGSLLVQWLAHLGTTVIATAGSAEKVERAQRAGAAFAIDYSVEDFTDAVRRYTDGHGVDVVYDGVGKATLHASLGCLKPRGLLVAFGNASGAPDALDPLELGRHGSIYLTRPRLQDYTRTRDELLTRAAALFGVLRSGALDVAVQRTYPLTNAAEAHRDLAARGTVGPSILIPDV